MPVDNATFYAIQRALLREYTARGGTPPVGTQTELPLAEPKQKQGGERR